MPEKDTTYIRFVNASPIESTLEVSVGANFKYQRVAFKKATPFIPVVNGKVALAIRQTSDNRLLADGNLTLTKNYVYTLFTKGVIGGTGTNAFGARILVTRQ
ncbi:DUF4397 domain-containing protein [Mucilaginibacter antarcticus]|uniref:DUF4397 domain-containing protein n=1 Tax=Mucilaginibacter antarcticus TaxID=1855725 RepID=UPI003641028F